MNNMYNEGNSSQCTFYIPYSFPKNDVLFCPPGGDRVAPYFGHKKRNHKSALEDPAIPTQSQHSFRRVDPAL